MICKAEAQLTNFFVILCQVMRIYDGTNIYDNKFRSLNLTQTAISFSFIAQDKKKKFYICAQLIRSRDNVIQPKHADDSSILEHNGL